MWQQQFLFRARDSNRKEERSECTHGGTIIRRIKEKYCDKDYDREKFDLSTSNWHWVLCAGRTRPKVDSIIVRQAPKKKTRRKKKTSEKEEKIFKRA